MNFVSNFSRLSPSLHLSRYPKLVHNTRLVQRRPSSTLHKAYEHIFKKNITYVTYIVGGCVILELLYGKLIDNIWDSVNKGKQFKDVDWSKFKSAEDEEEEEEE
mmetsp:Transcript_10265/g.14568  ORF Transcript_10265/g.14568 Transcript_10265/m.14568 type:complete len:104 (-) Transcript_10265:128-439(-)